MDNNDTQNSNEPKIEEIRDANGKLLRTISMLNGILHGPMVGYDEDGNVAQEMMYENGVLSGDAKFYMNTKLLMTTFFKNGLQEGNTEFFVNGLKSGSVTMKEGKFDGIFTSYDAAGNVIREANYVAGLQEGECRTYYPNGCLLEMSTYKNNVLDGEVVKYFQDGAVMQTSNFQEGKPVGTVDTYDNNGNLVSSEEV